MPNPMVTGTDETLKSMSYAPVFTFIVILSYLSKVSPTKDGARTGIRISQHDWMRKNSEAD